jgi:GPH family glycoside/pentoside/hexuronide:cation symporter
VVYIVALRAILTPDARHPVGQLNPLGYVHYGVLAAVVMFMAILISAAGTHRYIKTFRLPAVRRLGVLGVIREMLATWSHRSFLSLTVSGLLSSTAAGLAAAMNIYFNTFFWEFTAAQISIFAIGIFLSAIMALLAAPPLSRRFGKRPATMALTILAVAIGITPMLLRLAGLMPPNHTPALIAIIFCQSIITTALIIAASTLGTSMIADVVEDSELKTGRRSEGLFFSASSLVAKAVSGIGIFAASQILGLVHFPPNARPGQVSGEVIAHMALIYSPVIIVLYGASLVMLTGYKITRESHAETLGLLAARAARRAET